MNWSFDETYEERAQFWDPERPEDKHEGTFRFSPAGGCIVELVTGESGFRNEAQRSGDCLHGQLVRGTRVSLLGWHAVRFTSGTSRRTEVHLRVQRIVIGVLLDDVNAACFHKVFFSVRALEQVLGHAPFQVECTGTGAPHADRFSYRQQPHLGFPIKHLKARTHIQSHLQVQGSATKLELDHRAWIGTTFDERQNLDHCLATVTSYQQLLSILSGKWLSLREISLQVENASGGLSHPCVLFTQKSDVRSEIDFCQFSFYGDVKVDLADLAERWFDLRDAAERPLNVFLSEMSRPSAFLEQRFLTAMAALESVHRFTIQGSYAERRVWKDAAKILNSAIDQCQLTEEHKIALRSRLNFGNEFSQRKRILDLVQAIPPQARAGLFRNIDIDQFVKHAVNTRNSFTHMSKTPPWKGVRLHHGAMLLMQTFRFYVLSKIGISDVALAKAQSIWPLDQELLSAQAEHSSE